MSGTFSPRVLESQQLHFIRFRVEFNTPGIASGVQFGAIPAGSVIHSCRVNVSTAFNAATTNVLTVGTTATGTEIATSAQTVAGTIGGKSPTNGDGVRVAADTGIFASYTQTGAAATAGVADVVVAYVPNI